MIHHLSISDQNPQHVAQVLAEILQGQPTAHPFNPGGYIICLREPARVLFPLRQECFCG
jgi:hypothetical protein